VRIARWTAISLGGLLLLLGAAAWVLTSVIDPNRYRGRVETLVADLTGRPCVIEGNVEITWFPWLGVRMGHGRLGNPPEAPIAEWQSVAVAAKVLPLLQGQVVLDRIRLQSPHIRLRRDAHGQGNWENLGPRAAAGSGRRNNPPQVAGLEIRDGALEYVDDMSGFETRLSSLELAVGQWQSGAPLPIHTRFRFQGGPVAAQGIWVQVDIPELAVQFEPLNLSTPRVSARIATARIDGDLKYEQTAASQAAGGSVAMHVPSLRTLVNDLALNQTLPEDPTTLGPLELTGRWSYTNGALAVKPVLLKLDGVTLDGWVERAAAPRSAWTFDLHGDRIDLGRYANIHRNSKKLFELPVDTLRAINANGTVTFDHAELADTHLADLHLSFQTPEAAQ
jgi:AsmA protein